MEPILPRWAESLRSRYLAGESSVFLIHGNVRDVQPWADPDGTVRYVTMREFLTKFLSRNKDVVVYYNVSEGIEFASPAQQSAFKRGVSARRLLDGRDALTELPRAPGGVLEVIEDLVTDPSQRAAVVLDFIEMIVPNGDLSFMGEADKQNLVTLLRLGADPGLTSSDNLVILVTENLSDVHKRLVASSNLAVLEVPLPLQDERSQFFRLQDHRGISLTLTEVQLSQVTAGLTLVQIRGFLRQARQSGEPIEFASVNRRKKAIIEQECHGLVEFVDPKHDFSSVGGMDAVKEELLRVAEAIKHGQRGRVPMGAIFVGPMGTGKTFVAEAFAKESGLTCLKFKNFREKWVGSTEGNLEKILRVVEGLGYVLLIIDEADRSLSGGGEGDGGTSSRVIARLKEFMSDTSHRGRILILMMTNRPDKLDTDLKRPGRFDLKIPFFYPESADEREGVVRAVLRRSELPLTDGVDLSGIVEAVKGYSAAEIEAVVLAATNFAAWDARTHIGTGDLSRACSDTIPSRDVRMLEYMEMLAVFESSARRMLPERFAALGTPEVLAKLDVLRVQLGNRV
ncbi:MAG: ATP-binding protein [Myxococcales bacterium]|nr:ATP-binding protein [Myxococcales bacterium]